MTRYRALAALVGALALAACEENAVQEITGPLPASQVKFFNFGVGAPGVNFYADDRKVTAVGSTTGEESSTGVNYGGAGAGGLYTAIDPGQYTLSGRIAAAGDDKDLPISNLVATIESGRLYSFYQSGVYDATGKTIDAFIVEDPVPADFDYSVAYVRFVNAIFNSEPMTLYATLQVDEGQQAPPPVALGAAVAYKGAGTFTALPEGVYDLATRTAGSTTDVITRTDVSFNAGRVYTITARGDMTGTTTATRPFLDNTANR